MQPRAKTIQERFGFQDKELSTPRHDEIMLWLDENIDSVVLEINGPNWSPQHLNALYSEHEVMFQKERPARAAEVESAQKCVDPILRRMEEHREEIRSAEAILANGPPEKLPLSKRDYISTQTRDEWTQEYAGKIAGAKLSLEWRNTELVRAQRLLAEKQALASELRKLDLPEPPSRVKPSVLWKKWEKPIMSREYVVGFVDLAVGVKVNQIGITYGEKRDRYVRPKWQTYSMQMIYLFEVKPSISSLGEVIRQIQMYKAYVDGDGAEFFIVSTDDRFRTQLESQRIGFVKCP